MKQRYRWSDFKYIVAWAIYTRWPRWQIDRFVWRAIHFDAPATAVYWWPYKVGLWRTAEELSPQIQKELALIIEEEFKDEQVRG